ncbi:MAG: glutamate synthase subunit beta [Elusimicrobiota bacterium]
MGKPTGFIDFKRKDTPYRPVSERLEDYRDVNLCLSSEQLKEQAARCMDCGVPYCHALGCPLGNLIPEWNDLVYKGRWKEALYRLEMTNTLPEITGRICPATCEASCTLSINDSPVTIRQVELAIIEYGFERGWVEIPVPKKELEKKVAVIGSGPAGLSAAIKLRQTGYDVTVFEKAHIIGGILRYGIPDFKLEKWVLDRRIKQMVRAGIKFETDANMGEDMSARWLKKSFDAILLTTGAGYPRDIDIAGREVDGIYFAMEYLTQSNSMVAGEVSPDSIISAKDKDVLVIGGGDTGSDCVGTANRQGAKKVYQFEILPRPQEWDEPWNFSWPDWPVILRTTSSHEEGVERDWAITTKGFTGENKKVKKVHCTRVRWETPPGSCRPVMEEIPGSEFTVKVDMVILAMGFIHVEHSRLLKDLGVEYDECGNIMTENYSTSVGGVFAAGDADTGASLVVKAINHGMEAAKKIDEYLG